MGSYTVKHGDTPGALARKYLGNANRWRELWHGDPRKMPVGYVIHVPEGSPKPPPVGPPPPKPPPAPTPTPTPAPAPTPTAPPAPPAPTTPGGTPAGGSDPVPVPAAVPSGTTPTTSDQNKELANLPGPERDQLLSVVNQFMAMIGWPTNVDTQQLMYQLYKSGVQSQTGAQWQFLLNQIPPDMAKANPWAGFGMDEATYLTNVGKFTAQWTDITGQNISPDIIKLALQNQWTTTQMEQYAKFSPLAATEPWLQVGQTWKQTQEAYIASYGHAPQDDAVLKSWFNFGQTMKHVGSAAPGQSSTAAFGQRQQKESEVR